MEGLRRSFLTRFLLSPASEGQKWGLITHGSLYEYCNSFDLMRRSPANLGAQLLGKDAFDALLMRRILAKFDLVFALAERERAELRRVFKLRGEKVRVLGNFVSEEQTSQPPGIDATVSNHAPYVCAVSRIHPRKNFLSAIRAIQGIGLSFVLAGEDWGGLRILKNEVARKSLQGFVYLGQVSESRKRAIIRGSVGTLLPSFFEGVPFGVLESLALSRPAVCTRWCYLDHYSGLVFCDPTPESVRSALQRLLDNPPVPDPAQLPRLLDVVDELLRCVS